MQLLIWHQRCQLSFQILNILNSPDPPFSPSPQFLHLTSNCFPTEPTPWNIIINTWHFIAMFEITNSEEENLSFAKQMYIYMKFLVYISRSPLNHQLQYIEADDSKDFLKYKPKTSYFRRFLRSEKQTKTLKLPFWTRQRRWIHLCPDQTYWRPLWYKSMCTAPFKGRTPLLSRASTSSTSSRPPGRLVHISPSSTAGTRETQSSHCGRGRLPSSARAPEISC